MTWAGFARSGVTKGVLLRLLNFGVILCAPALAIADRGPASKKSCPATLLKLGDSKSTPIRLADETGLVSKAGDVLSERLTSAIRNWTKKDAAAATALESLKFEAVPKLRVKLESAEREFVLLNKRSDSNKRRSLVNRLVGEVVNDLNIEKAVWQVLATPLKNLKAAIAEHREAQRFETTILQLRRALETQLGPAISDPLEMQATVDHLLETEAGTIQKIFDEEILEPGKTPVYKKVLAQMPVANFDWNVSAPDLVDYRAKLLPIRQKLFDQVIGPIVTELRTRVQASRNAEAARSVWFSNLPKAFDLAFEAAEAVKLNTMRIRDLSDRVQKFVVNYQSVSQGLILKGLVSESQTFTPFEYAVLLPLASKIANRMNSKFTHDHIGEEARERARPAYEAVIFGRMTRFLKTSTLKRRLVQEGPEELQAELWQSIFGELPIVNLEDSGVSQSWIKEGVLNSQSQNPTYVRAARILDRRARLWGQAFGSNEAEAAQIVSVRSAQLSAIAAPLIQSGRINPRDDSMKVELNLWSTLSQAGVSEEVWSRLPNEYRQMYEELRGQIGQSYYEMLVGLTIEKILFRENAKGWSEESAKSLNERLVALLPSFQKTLKSLTPEMSQNQVQSIFRPLADNIFIYIKNYYFNGVDVVADDASTGDLWNLAVRELDRRLPIEIDRQISNPNLDRVAEVIEEKNEILPTPDQPVPQVADGKLEVTPVAILVPVSFESKLEEITNSLAKRWKGKLLSGTISRMALDKRMLFQELKQQFSVILLDEVQKDPTLKDAENGVLVNIASKRFIDLLRLKTPGGRAGAQVGAIVQRAVNALELGVNSSPDDASIMQELAKTTGWTEAEMLRAIKVWRKSFERDRMVGSVGLVGKDGALDEVSLVEVLPSPVSLPGKNADENLSREKLERARHDGVAMTFIQMATINVRFELLRMKVERIDYSGEMFSTARKALQSALSLSDEDLEAHYLIMLSPFNPFVPSSNPNYSRLNELAEIAKNVIRGLRKDQRILLSTFLFTQSPLDREAYYQANRRALNEIFSLWMSETPFRGNFQKFDGVDRFLFEATSNKIPPRFVKDLLEDAGFAVSELDTLEKEFWNFQVRHPVYQSEGLSVFMIYGGETIEKSTGALTEVQRQRYKDTVADLVARFKKYLAAKKK